MQCPSCREESPSSAASCGKCGAELNPTCPQCGKARGQGDNFCRNCGQPLTHTSTPALTATAPRFASPASYTPGHLIERILTSKGALEGERKQVTVLFADVKGSMELLVARDPEEARKLLDPVLEHMMEAVHRYEGTVNQVMGDGIMALFGAPVAHEDHAVRACYAALRMQEAVKRYAEAIRRTEGVLIQVRVGLNSGEVVVRAIGSDLRMDYSAVGQTTHLAGRMEQMAAAGSILITHSTLALAEGHVQANPLGLMPVKGLHAPVEVYELAGGVMGRSRAHVLVARGRTRFVGRDGEMELLRQALERAGTSHGQVVTIVGEPGIGKSRLYWEFTHSHLTRGWLVLESGAVSYGASTPYLPIRELLKSYFQIDARDDARTIREKVTGKALSLDRALESRLPALLALLEVPVEDAAWERLDPSQRRLQTLEAVKSLLLREALAQPLLLVVEDLHWADSETLALLDGFVESLPAARVLLLVNYRPEYQDGWGDRTYCWQLRIDPLATESVADLLTSVLGAHPSVDGLKRMLIERTEGNPLFLEESVRTLAETKALVGERGAYHLLLDAETIQIPSTVQALLAARIDRLAPEDKELLQAASVIGKDVPSALLHAITGWPDETLHGAIARLQAAELLYETRLFPDLEYTFKHTLTQEVAYRSLLQHRRRALHTQILEAIEALFADRLPEQTERLAHHAYRGEMWDKAVSYYRQAGSKALERSAYREAVVCFEHALSALARLPDSRATTEAAIDLRLDTVLAHFPLADAEQPRTYMSEAETLARDLDDQFRLFRVYTAQTLLALWEADYDQAIAAGQRAAAIADRLGDLGPQITASVQLGAAYLGSGQHQQASALHTDTIAALQGELLYTRFGFGTGTSSVVPTRAERPGLAWVHSLAAMSQAECGHLVAAGSLAAEAWRIAEQVDRPVDIVVAGLSMGWVSLHTGDVAANIPLLDHCRVMCRDLGLLRYAPFINAVLGYSLAYDERFSDALPLLMEAVEQAASRAILFYHARWVLWTGETQLRLGHVDDALRLARQALELSRTRKERGTEAWALRLLGEIAGHAPSAALDEADRYYQQALTLAGNLGMRPLVAHCHVGLASLSWRAGKSEEARAELGTAMTMFHETGMGPWRQKAEAAMRRLASSA